MRTRHTSDTYVRPTAHPEERIALVHIQGDRGRRISGLWRRSANCRDARVEKQPLGDVLKVGVAFLIHVVERRQVRIHERYHDGARVGCILGGVCLEGQAKSGGAFIPL